jgi:hypothetical protein
MPAPSSDRSRPDLLRRIGAVAFAICVAFGPAAFVHAPLLRGELPVFRDVRHFYQPMERRQQQAWSEGRIPLWNAEGTGFPEFAEPTAATFYPGKLIFALPLPWGARWFLYFVGHAGVGCFGARRFARSCGLTANAGLFAGAAYAASGELLFQSCNPVYLVGAAWLPWALAESMLLRRTPSLSHAVGLAAAMTLAFLGGDPQTVYHVALLIAGAFVIEIPIAAFAWAKRRISGAYEPDRRSIGGASSQAWLRRARFAGSLIFAGALTAGLSAIQLIPAIEWFRQSDRAALVQADGQEDERAEASAFNRFDFSVGPWRWVDFLVPEVWGSPFPIQRRWSYAIVPETRVWTPSYYMGLAPLLLIPAALIVSRMRRRLVIPLGLAVASLAFALGHYGLGYFAKEVASHVGGAVEVSSPWGGPYWLLAEWAPLYDLFRYPAKWMPAATLGIAVAGATGFDALRYPVGRRMTRTVAAVASLAFAIALAAMWLPTFRDWWSALPIGVDSTFGPWDAAGALTDLRWNLLHVAFVAAILFCLTAAAAKSRRRRMHGPSWMPPALILLAAVDAAVANRNLAPAGRFSPEPASTIDWASLGVDAEGPTAMRYLRGSIDGLAQAAWKEASLERLVELAEWERSSYFSRLGPGPDGPPALRSTASLEPADLAPFLSAWRDSRLTARDADAAATIDRLEDLSVGLLILPPGVQPIRGEFVRNVTLPPTGSEVAIWRLPNAQPRWAMTQDPTLIQRAEEALATETALDLTHKERGTLRPASLRFLEVDGQSVVAAYDFDRPTLLVWNDRFDRGWHATDRALKDSPTEPREFGEVSGNGRFVLLPPSGTIRFDYRPASFAYGALLTAIAAAVAIAALAAPAIRNRRRRR